MHDIKKIRENPNAFDKGLQRRGLPLLSSEILSLDEDHRSLLDKLQHFQQKKNEVAEKMARAKRNGESLGALISEGTSIKKSLPDLEEKERETKEKLFSILASIPNILNEDAPLGTTEEDNNLVRSVGDIPSFSFSPKEHFELGESLKMMDFGQAAKLSGSRFVVLKKDLALLERALAAFMIDVHTKEFGYEFVSSPLLVNSDSMFRAGQLPKFAEDAFQTTNGHWLIPTAEVPLTCLAADQILEEKVLPLRYTAHTACFRSEAGSAGRDTRGMLRQHQFYKVELVSLVEPDDSENEFHRMVSAAEEILKRLELPYRVMELCSGDIGFCSKKTYDLEVWIPGQNCYREISSCSLCGDFQARRMKARYRNTKTKKPDFIHTLNGSGVAVGRALIAVLENYQMESGSIRIPEVLIPYMNGKTEISL
jgi:seryl-tRNA synthetase